MGEVEGRCSWLVARDSKKGDLGLADPRLREDKFAAGFGTFRTVKGRFRPVSGG
jgi:hypothetical protein